MNILFVLYGDFTSNSADPLVLYARELHRSGNNCAVAVPFGRESVSHHENPSFRPILYADVLAGLDSIFPDGRPADVIHACTPREVVRRFVTAYMAKQPTPLVVYLEDNELWVSMRVLGFDETNLVRHTEAEISDLLPDALAHPFYYDSFIGLADAVAIIQDKLRIKVPPWMHCETVMIGVDLELFTPRAPDLSLRTKYGVAEHAVRPEIGAVGAILYYPNDTIQHAGVTLGLNGNPGVAGHRYHKQPRGYAGQVCRGQLCQNLSAVTAACLVVCREVFEAVGGFNEAELAIAFNDVDLCLRIAEKGYRNLWTPYAEFYHHANRLKLVARSRQIAAESRLF